MKTNLEDENVCIGGGMELYLVVKISLLGKMARLKIK